MTIVFRTLTSKYGGEKEEYVTCIALIIVPTKGKESWDSEATMVGNNS